VKHTESIPISSLRLDGGTQPRAALDFSAVDDYADAMADGTQFPPVIVYYDGENYWLADGFHRVKAAHDAGCDTIRCEVRQGTLEDAQWYSFSANKTNGLRRTNEDKQRAIKAALLHPRGANLSDSQIAKHVGVHHDTVRDWRAKLESSCGIRKITARTVTRKGKSYQQNTANIGRRSQKTGSPEPQDIARQLLLDDRFQPVLEALRQVRSCHAAASELAAWITTQPQQFELIQLLEEIHGLINEVLARTGQATADS
jgi:transposase-like protein